MSQLITGNSAGSGMGVDGGGILDGESKEEHPSKFQSENDRTPPETWGDWERERLKPPGTTLLRPMAWSAFFLAATPLPLAFPGNTPDDAIISSLLFAVAWSLVLLSLLSVGSLSRHPSQSHAYDIFPLDMPSLLIAVALFLAHVFVNPVLGWASYATFWYSWIKLTRSLTDSTYPSNGRWAKEIDPLQFNHIGLVDGWAFTTGHFKTGIIGVGPPVAPQSRLVIEGVRASNVAHIAISILHRSGFRHDPFQHRVDVRDIDLLLEKPPLTFRTDDPPSSD